MAADGSRAAASDAAGTGGAPLELRDLLVHQTPRFVRESYETLRDRVGELDLAPLTDGFVVLDTETTGLSFRECQLIQISAARLDERGRICDEFSTFVDPGQPIPATIVGLTGIRDVDVAGAPGPVEAVAALADFVAGAPVLAHNATFDRTFVEAVRGGGEVSDLWIDTLALSRVALPCLRSHRLADMAEAFGCAAVTHNATDDVAALAGMWPLLLRGLADLPVGALAALAGAHPEVEWAYRPIFAYLAEAVGGGAAGAAAGAGSDVAAAAGVRFSLGAWRRERVVRRDQARPDASELDRIEAPTAAQMDEAFGPGGVVSRMYDDWEPRREQAAMAREVAGALADGTHRAIEAGTGVGKSMAYLLPEVLLAKRNGVTVGVATKTNALTDQLVSHELPLLDQALGVDYVAIKGMEHYTCLHRLERALGEPLPVESVQRDGRGENAVRQDMLNALAVALAHACQSADGDLDALGIRWHYVPRQLLACTPGECLRRRCPYFDVCMCREARRHAASADVVVTNHSLLLSDIAADGAILPPIRHWVVDEAHGLESEAREQWALEVSAEKSRPAFEQLGGTHSGVLQRLLVEARRLDGSALVAGLLAKASEGVSRASVCMEDLLLAVHGLLALEPGRGGGYDQVVLWLGEERRATPEWAEVAEAGARAADALDASVRALVDAHDALAAEAPELAAELAGPTRTLRELLEAVRVVCDGSDQSYVYLAQLWRAKRRLASERLLAQKVEVGPDLAQRWLDGTRSVIFCSATLAVGEDFSRFERAVGLSLAGPGRSRSLRLRSSFDFDRQMSVLVASDLPDQRERGYLRALEDLLFDVHVAMGGSVLTLFTNRREMEQVFAGLRPRLEAEGLELLCQERGTSPRRLRERFLEERSVSLLALKSFWEGFDASGDTLRCVVIAKLPFASPNDPLNSERRARTVRAGGKEYQTFMEYSVPDAVIEVKQAAGRLIRSSTDAGVLVLADSRVVTKGYGKKFVQSLPSRTVNYVSSDLIGRYIQSWRRSHER